MIALIIERDKQFCIWNFFDMSLLTFGLKKVLNCHKNLEIDVKICT